MGIRIDSANAFTGAIITPFYDSLLVKIIAHAQNHEAACAKVKYCLLIKNLRNKFKINHLIN